MGAGSSGPSGTAGQRSTGAQSAGTAAVGLPTSPIVVSVIENRAREVGLGWMNLRAPSLHVLQFSDNQTYTLLITMLHNLAPTEVD